jgi:single-stranded-DNA-specific exonuclease
MAADLDDLNKSRREIEQGMQQEAEQVLKSLNFSDDNLPHAIALFQRDWHQGVIGIVAGRLKEKFHRPSIVFAGTSDDISANHLDQSTEIKGSARSIPGLHIRDLLEHIDTKHPNIIIKFGGHAMAAGLSILEDNFVKFQQLFNQYAEQWLSSDDLKGTLSSDGELPMLEMTLGFAQLLRDSGPWGQNFIEPLFDGDFKLVQQRIVGQKHLKLVVEKAGKVFDAIAFNVDLSRWPDHKAQQVHLAYRLDINEFRGKQTVQFMVEYLE